MYFFVYSIFTPKINADVNVEDPGIGKFWWKTHQNKIQAIADMHDQFLWLGKFDSNVKTFTNFPYHIESFIFQEIN